MLAQKKIEVVEVIQWSGRNLEEVRNFSGDNFIRYEVLSDAAWQVGKGIPFTEISFNSATGEEVRAVNGDYVIKDVNGNISVRKPKSFHRTYNLVEDTSICENLSFDKAIDALTRGGLLTRKSWGTDNRYIYLVSSADLQRGLKYGYGEYENEPTIRSTIAVQEANGDILIGWTASSIDILSNDWKILS